jgi:hypothetical protein
MPSGLLYLATGLLHGSGRNTRVRSVGEAARISDPVQTPPAGRRQAQLAQLVSGSSLYGQLQGAPTYPLQLPIPRHNERLASQTHVSHE